MNASGGVGILGVGTYLPPEIRGNHWWPADVVERWTQGQIRSIEALRSAPAPASAGARRVVQAMLELDSDPFFGTVERRVMSAAATATDLEVPAAEAALLRAGVDRDQIDLLLIYSAVPDHVLSNSACALHHRLGLRASCVSLEVQASSYSFLAQLALAVPYIETGRARHALLVQSSAISRLLDPGDPVSARFGDAATAVVVGPVGRDHGVLGSFHCTDGSSPRSLIASVRGGRWYDGRSVLHMADPEGAQRAFLASIDQVQEAVAGALAAAGLRPEQVDYLAIHQATPWLARLARDHAGLGRARMVDVYARTAHVFASTVPLVLAAGEEEGVLVSGDVVMLVAAGVGMMRGATAMRWGAARS